MELACQQIGASLLAIHATMVCYKPPLKAVTVIRKNLRLDRGLPGDGLVDIPSIGAMLEDAGYDGPCEVEVFSADNCWRRDPDEVVEIIKQRFRTLV